jgi:hypothetical protein
MFPFVADLDPDLNRIGAQIMKCDVRRRHHQFSFTVGSNVQFRCFL